MVSINLLKDQRDDERLARKRARLELFAGVCVIASVCAFWGWVAIDVTQSTQRLERKIQAKQSRVALLQTTRQEVLALEEQRQVMTARQERVTALTSELNSPIRLLSVISRVVDPLDVWLLHLQAKDEKITLSGVARSLRDVLKLAKEFEKGLGAVDVVGAGPHAQLPDLFQFSMNVWMGSPDHGGTNS
ncbi:MAG: hypothetical protein OXL95_01685 [Nitrospira sp.]|nr:hypothetical protein [Nitrospira sp.]